MKLYFDLLSQPSRALFIFLKLNKIPFEPVVVKLGRGEQLKSSFKQINRFQKAPCIDDNGFKLAESVAVFRYIVASNPTVADHWYPKDIKERARVDEYLEWQHNNTRVACAGFFRTKYIEPMLKWKNPPSAKKIEASKVLMEKTLDSLENIWLEDQSKAFLATKEISFADILASCELEQPKLCDYDPFAGRPKLAKWHQQVKEQTNPIYDEAHAVVHSFIGTQERSRFYKMWKLYFSYNY
jgi:glutathione S-transferase